MFLEYKCLYEPNAKKFKNKINTSYFNDIITDLSQLWQLHFTICIVEICKM